MNSADFGKAMENVKKKQRSKPCRNRKKKKLFGVRAQVSYYINYY